MCVSLSDRRLLARPRSQGEVGEGLVAPFTSSRPFAGGSAPIAIACGATGMPAKNTFCTPCTITLSVGVEARGHDAQAVDHAAELDVLARGRVVRRRARRRTCGPGR